MGLAKMKRSTHALYPSHINRTPPAGRAGFGRRCALAVLQSAHRWDAQAALAHLHYGYLDWIARQGVPFTAEDEYLEGWAALKGVYRKPAQAAAGRVTFTGAPGAVIPKGAPLVRSDGMTF